MITLLSYGLAAGAFAALNPCGFAMLPAVISRYLTREERSAPLLEGLKLGALLTLGTLTAFSVIGLILSAFGTGIATALPFVNVLLGVLLLVMAVLTFLGRPPSLNLTRLRAPSGRGIGEFYPFGIAYGLASLGCTLPIFMGIVATTTSRSVTDALTLFAAYGLGMGGVLTAVTLAAALGKDAVLQGFRRAGRYVEFIGGVGLLAAGAYLIYYQAKFLELLYTGESTILPVVTGSLALIVAAFTARVLYVRETRLA